MPKNKFGNDVTRFRCYKKNTQCYIQKDVTKKNTQCYNQKDVTKKNNYVTKKNKTCYTKKYRR